MSNFIVVYIMRAVRAAVATWLASAVANNIWYAPIIIAVGKALRDRFPGAVEKWLPI